MDNMKMDTLDSMVDILMGENKWIPSEGVNQDDETVWLRYKAKKKYDYPPSSNICNDPGWTKWLKEERKIPNKRKRTFLTLYVETYGSSSSEDSLAMTSSSSFPIVGSSSSFSED